MQRPPRRTTLIALTLVGVFALTSCQTFASKVNVFNGLYGTQFSTSQVEKNCANAGFDAKACDNHLNMLIAAKLARPWDHDVRRTTDARNCIAGHESANAGGYVAENGGTPGIEGRGYSTASGRYQFVDGTWRWARDRAEQHYGHELGNEGHAAFAPPWVQDVVGAFSLAHPGIVTPRPWPYGHCYALVR